LEFQLGAVLICCQGKIPVLLAGVPVEVVSSAVVSSVTSAELAASDTVSELEPPPPPQAVSITSAIKILLRIIVSTVILLYCLMLIRHPECAEAVKLVWAKL
jgi:hypothetical protein